MGVVRRAGEPPKAGLYVPVFRIKAARPQRYCLFSPAIWAYWTHWVNRRTVPCRSLDSDLCCCPFKEEPQRWKGYAFCQMIGGKLGFIELTPDQGRQMADQVKSGETFRGLFFDFYRSSDDKGSRAYALRVPEMMRPAAELPQDRDPESLLLKLWGAPPKKRCM